MSDKPQTAAPPAKKKSGKLLTIAGAVLVLVGGGGAAAYWTLRKPAADAAEAKAEAEKKPESSGIVGFEPFVVNLADPGKQRFLRINVQLVVGEEEEAKHIEENAVERMRLRSAIIELLTEQTSDHIVTPEGKAELKKQIAERAHHIVEPTEVSDVLFSDFVVQY
jgi:flagellar FliL protein